MTDGDAQGSLTPTEPTPAPEVVTQAYAEPAPSSPEPTTAIEPAISAEPTPTILEESQSALSAEVESQPVLQQNSVAQSTVPSSGRKWNADDRAKSATTHARKIDARLAKIVEYVKSHGGKITNDDIEKLLRVSDATASRYAKMVVARGLLRVEGKGRGVRYAL